MGGGSCAGMRGATSLLTRLSPPGVSPGINREPVRVPHGITPWPFPPRVAAWNLRPPPPGHPTTHIYSQPESRTSMAQHATVRSDQLPLPVWDAFRTSGTSP